ncbi:hypothetical protein GCM10027299_09370 [Larkinella ripae]
MPKYDHYSKPITVHDQSYDVPESGQFTFPDFTAQDWWRGCTGGVWQVIAVNESNPSVYDRNAEAIVAFNEIGDDASIYSSPLSNFSPPQPMEARRVIRTTHIMRLSGTAKINLKVFSTYYDDEV